jgi:D-alanyl-D-alanine carboxypeptidase (penicillin-binding protein 5/6)
MLQGRPRPRLLIVAVLFVALAGAAVFGYSILSDRQSASASEGVSAAAEARDTMLAQEAIEPPAAAPAKLEPPFWASAPLLKPSIAPQPAIAAISAVVIDEASGAVLFDKNAHQQMQPASLTKIDTLILALEYGHLDEDVVSDVDSASMRGSTIMGLEPGDHFALRDLLYGLMLPSGNDAALAIGRHIAGKDANFVTMMNNLVARLGLNDTHFLNPHGLGGGDAHHTSAYDLAMLSRYGMSLPGFKDIVTTGDYFAKGSRTIEVANINAFLYNYPGAEGIKTGYTRGAGHTMVAAATRNGHRLYAVILNSDSKDVDASRILNWAFASFDWPVS